MNLTKWEEEKFKHLLQTWTVAYEQALVTKFGFRPKQVFDEACYYAAKDWIERLHYHGIIPENKGKELDTVEDCVRHYIDNLIAGGMWPEGIRPTMTPTDDGENVFLIEIPACAYLDGCKDACKFGMDGKDEFQRMEQFRCKRLGCFAGAVRKYMIEEKLTDPAKVTYFMITVHQDSGCKGLFFVNERDGFRKELLAKYLEHLR